MNIYFWSAAAVYIALTTYMVGVFWWLGSRDLWWALSGAILYALMPVTLLALLWPGL